MHKEEILDLVKNWPRSETMLSSKMAAGRAGLSYLLTFPFTRVEIVKLGKEKVLAERCTWGSWLSVVFLTFYSKKTDKPT